MKKGVKKVRRLTIAVSAAAVLIAAAIPVTNALAQQAEVAEINAQGANVSFDDLTRTAGTAVSKGATGTIFARIQCGSEVACMEGFHGYVVPDRELLDGEKITILRGEDDADRLYTYAPQENKYEFMGWESYGYDPINKKQKDVILGIEVANIQADIQFTVEHKGIQMYLEKDAASIVDGRDMADDYLTSSTGAIEVKDGGADDNPAADDNPVADDTPPAENQAISLRFSQTTIQLPRSGLDSAKLDYTFTIDGKEVTDAASLAELEVRVENTAGFNTEELADLKVADLQADQTVLAGKSGVAELTLAYHGVESENKAYVVVPGDLNRDGTVSVSDAMNVIRFIRGGADAKEIYNQELADMDGNGSLDIEDVRIIADMIHDGLSYNNSFL